MKGCRIPNCLKQLNGGFIKNFEEEEKKDYEKILKIMKRRSGR